MKTNEMDELNLNISEDSNQKDNITYLSGMYKEWFLDYASYVINTQLFNQTPARKSRRFLYILLIA